MVKTMGFLEQRRNSYSLTEAGDNLLTELNKLK